MDTAKTRRWVIEALDTSNEHLRQIYGEPLPGPPPRPGQQVIEGTVEELAAAKDMADRRARSRCGFCDGPRPCTRDD